MPLDESGCNQGHLGTVQGEVLIRVDWRLPSRGVKRRLALRNLVPHASAAFALVLVMTWNKLPGIHRDIPGEPGRNQVRYAGGQRILAISSVCIRICNPARDERDAG